MTAAELETKEATPEISRESSPRRYLAVGTGVAVEVNGTSLEVAVMRSRPDGPRFDRVATVQHFRERPAAEWGSEFSDVVKGHNASGVTVLLPRADVIVRHVSLPGVIAKEMAGALALRLRGLHPFAEDDVAWCWTPAGSGALVGLIRKTVLGFYEALFSEAGVPVASFTFSASVLYACLRLYSKILYSQDAPGFLGLVETAGGTEAYGENSSGTIFSGEFRGAADRAAEIGMAELRLPDTVNSLGLARLLPRGKSAVDLIERPLLYATGVVAACPWVAKTANFLPPERRVGQLRIWVYPTIALTAILILCGMGIFAMGPWSQRQYVAALHQEIAHVEPVARRAATIDAQTGRTRAQIQTLDSFKARSKSDFEVLNELTRIIPAPGWASTVEIFPDYVIIGGEAEQAASLVKALDSSPLFRNSEFTNSVTRGSGNLEQFRIKTYRRSH